MNNAAWDRDDTSIDFRLTTFQKQVLAFNYANKVNVRSVFDNQSPVHVFARECSKKGHRYYLVLTIHSFYMKYTSMTDRDLTFYEILRAGFPCRMYFDIEYDKLLNPAEDGEVSMRIFKTFLIAHVRETLGFDISPLVIKSNSEFNGHIVELDASNSKKFSRHLIITLPRNFVFRNNVQVGEFVNSMCKKITEKASLDYSGDPCNLSADALTLRRMCFLKKIPGNIVRYKLFVDQSV